MNILRPYAAIFRRVTSIGAWKESSEAEFRRQFIDRVACDARARDTLIGGILNHGEHGDKISAFFFLQRRGSVPT